MIDKHWASDQIQLQRQIQSQTDCQTFKRPKGLLSSKHVHTVCDTDTDACA